MVLLTSLPACLRLGANPGRAFERASNRSGLFSVRGGGADLERGGAAGKVLPAGRTPIEPESSVGTS